MAVSASVPLADRPTRTTRRTAGVLVALVAALALVLVPLYAYVPPGGAPTPYRTPPGPVRHVVEIMFENHAFDNFFGGFPGADGPPNGTALPNGSGGTVAPYWIDGNSTPDPPHQRPAEIADVDGGRMDGFVEQMALVDPSAAATPMGYYNGSQLASLWGLAREFVLCEDYFASVLGPTVPNRLYAMAGSSAGITTDVEPFGVALPTIFDQLTAYGLSWSYFYEPGTVPPLPAVLRPLSDSPAKLADLRPLSELAGAISSGALPALTFVDPEGTPYSQHPPDSILPGEAWLSGLLASLETSPEWSSTVVFVTWDEGGGFYDRVLPPTVDGLGDGFRVPMLVISPFSRGGGISTGTFDHTSVLHFVEAAWGLPFLNARVAGANDLCATLVGLPASERCQAAPPLRPASALRSVGPGARPPPPGTPPGMARWSRAASDAPVPGARRGGRGPCPGGPNADRRPLAPLGRGTARGSIRPRSGPGGSAPGVPTRG